MSETKIYESIKEWEEKASKEAQEMPQYQTCGFKIGDEVETANYGKCKIQDVFKVFNPFTFEPVMAVMVKTTDGSLRKLHDYKKDILKVYKKGED